MGRKPWQKVRVSWGAVSTNTHFLARFLRHWISKLEPTTSTSTSVLVIVQAWQSLIWPCGTNYKSGKAIHYANEKLMKFRSSASFPPQVMTLSSSTFDQILKNTMAGSSFNPVKIFDKRNGIKKVGILV